MGSITVPATSSTTMMMTRMMNTLSVSPSSDSATVCGNPSERQHAREDARDTDQQHDDGGRLRRVEQDLRKFPDRERSLDEPQEQRVHDGDHGGLRRGEDAQRGCRR